LRKGRRKERVAERRERGGGRGGEEWMGVIAESIG
jgi:hypothetical protein